MSFSAQLAHQPRGAACGQETPLRTRLPGPITAPAASDDEGRAKRRHAHADQAVIADAAGVDDATANGDAFADERGVAASLLYGLS